MLVHNLHSLPLVVYLAVVVLELRMTHSLKDVLVVEVLLELSGEKEDSIHLLILMMFYKYKGGKF